MAEFCLKCLNKMDGTKLTEADVIIDHDELDICEGCGQWQPCVVRYRTPLERLIYNLTHPKKESGA